MVNELNRRRFLALGFVIAGVLVAQAFQYVDGEQPVLMVLGIVLGFVTVFGAIWAALKLNELRCPHCGQRFSPLFPNVSSRGWPSPLSNRCANCSRAYTDA
jgi:hypothetical protein